MKPSFVASARRAVVLCALAFWFVGCNSRNPILDSAVTLPLPAASTGTTQPLPAATILQIGFNPLVVTGGGTSRGTVTATFPAPPGGLVIRLSSGDSAVTTPPAVTLPAGAESVDFMVATQPVATDRVVSISGSAPDRTVNAPLQLWTTLTQGFSFVSEAGDFIGGGGFGRFTPGNAAISGRCYGSEVQFSVTAAGGDNWSATFGAPRGAPLRAGVYEGVARASFRAPGQPGLDISGRAHACNALSGRFVVVEADYTPFGNVRRFWATFEQRCDSSKAALVGEVRLTDVPFANIVPYGACSVP